MSAFTSDYYSRSAISGLTFEFLNKPTIYKLSVKEILNPFALDKLLNPVPNGLYDLALGPIDKNDVCVTCRLDFFKCPGHYGHIDLVLPVYNPIFFKGKPKKKAALIYSGKNFNKKLLIKRSCQTFALIVSLMSHAFSVRSSKRLLQRSYATS